MKTVKYFQITTLQLFIMSILIGIIASSGIIINMRVKEFYQLPEVTTSDGKCVNVASFNNGEAYTCADVDVTLRNYRIKK